MEPRYHAWITAATLGGEFDALGLEEIIKANTAQDSLLSLLNIAPEHHVDNSRFADAWTYIEKQHLELRATEDDRLQRRALGRLLHTVQDLYAHSNYVDLWLACQPPGGTPPAHTIDPLDNAILTDPALRSGSYVPVLGIAYLIPVVGRWLARLYVPEGSHEALNLDSPSRGPRFEYAWASACKRTRYEYSRAATAVLECFGAEGLARFRRPSAWRSSDKTRASP